MVVFLRRQVVEKPTPANPFVAPPAKEEDVEDIGVSALFDNDVSKHFETPSFGSSSIGLYPVAGGVGLSTMVRYGHGVLSENHNNCDAVILVSTTAADHLFKAQNLLRVGTIPGGQQIIGIVLVEDRPKLSKETIKEAKKTLRMTKHSWGIPFVNDLREPKEVTKLPYRYRKALESLVKVSSS
ncbi:DUF6668 family protein [Rothia sp. P5764]|uniref:DUF6668 family protein n=1 Tax=Rothia sp. P5764 TaxID=3402654 RepID=UPI003AC95FCC